MPSIIVPKLKHCKLSTDDFEQVYVKFYIGVSPFELTCEQRKHTEDDIMMYDICDLYIIMIIVYIAGT